MAQEDKKKKITNEEKHTSAGDIMATDEVKVQSHSDGEQREG